MIAPHLPQRDMQQAADFTKSSGRAALRRRKFLRPPGLPVMTKRGSPSASPFLKFWSGRRVSNSRPQPWQGCALPTELLPHRGELRKNITKDVWSGRRVSNSRPQPWQGCALPTELLPHFRVQRRMRILRLRTNLSRARRKFSAPRSSNLRRQPAVRVCSSSLGPAKHRGRMVPETGVEPVRPCGAADFKSATSTSFVTLGPVQIKKKGN